MPEQRQIHVAIVGGGIGGVLLGIALARFQHITYTIFESRAAFGEIGAGVAFFKNGHTAMQLIDPRIWEGYSQMASFNGWDDKQGVWFDFVRGERGGAEGSRIVEVLLDEPRGLSQVHRASLLDALVRLLPAGVAQFNKRLVSVDQGPPGGEAVCHFADGSQREADLVVGCDGIWSACRPLVIDDPGLASPRFTSKVAYRGLVPMKAAEEVLGREHANNRTMYLGRGGHVLTFPVANGTLMNAVAFHESEKDTWEGEYVQKVEKDMARRDFSEAQWGSSVVNIVELLQPDVWAIFEHPPVPTFHKGRICLLGDAAHAMSPHLGQGAGMAIEDAFILSRLLGECSSREDISAALAAYDFVRVPRASGVAADSLENGKRLDLQGSTAGSDFDKIAAELDKVARWMWNLDLDEHLSTAIDKFKQVRKSQ